MNRQPTLAVAVLLVASLTIIGGCANPRGTANAMSAVIPVTSPAVTSQTASTPVESSPVQSRPASSAASTTTAATRIGDSTQIDGVYTADNERELVISYVAGDCTVSARGVATEAASSITVHVEVTTRNAICGAVGYVRTAVVPLSAPWGHRVVRDPSGAVLSVVDGALLLRPSWLPDGYRGGGITAFASEDGMATADQEWGPPSVTATSAAGDVSCPPTPGVSLVQGHGITAAEPVLPGSYSLADGTALTVTRDQLNDLALYWTPPGHPQGWSVAVQSTPECGNPVLSLDTLLKVANSLH